MPGVGYMGLTLTSLLFTQLGYIKNSAIILRSIIL